MADQTVRHANATKMIAVGLFMILGAIGLTYFSYTLAGAVGAGSYSIPVGLAVFGVIAVIRGIVAGAKGR